MRIIAGEFRRRVLHSPPGQTTRPIPDRVKEALFSMLGQRVVGAQVVDLFAGSGAIGLEAVSRGAAGCLLVEMDKLSAATLEKNVEMLRCGDRTKVVRGDALGLSIVARCPRPTDLIFMDPPYPLIETPAGWQRVVQQASQLVQVLAPDGFLILRTPVPHVLTEQVVSQASVPTQGRRFRKHDKPRKYDWRDEASRGPGEGAQERSAKRGSPERKAAGRDEDGDEIVELSEEELAKAMEGMSAEELAELAAGEIVEERMGGPVAEGAKPASHEIPGARGPETHRYGTMDVHFYMKA